MPKMSIEILSGKEFDKLRKSNPRYEHTGDSLGFADPKEGKAYVMQTHWPELNDWLVQHELEHLLKPEMGLAHQDEHGVYHSKTIKKVKSFFKKAVPKELVDVLPTIGAIAGNLIPIPGVGSAIGGTLGRIGREAFEDPTGGGSGVLQRTAGSLTKDIPRSLAIGAAPSIAKGVTSLGKGIAGAADKGIAALGSGGGQTALQQFGVKGVGETLSGLAGQRPGTAAGQVGQTSQAGGLAGSPLLQGIRDPLAGITGPGVAGAAGTLPQIGGGFTGGPVPSGGAPTAIPPAPSLGGFNLGSAPGAPGQQPGALSLPQTPPPPPGQPSSPAPQAQALVQTGGQGQTSTGGQAGIKKGNILSDIGTSLLNTVAPQGEGGNRDLSGLLQVGAGLGLAGGAGTGAFGPQTPEVPNLREIPSIQQLTQTATQAQTPLGEAARTALGTRLTQEFSGANEAVTAQIDRTFDDQRKNLESQFKQFRPNADIATDSGLRRAVFDLENRRAEALGSAEQTEFTRFQEQQRQDIAAGLGVDQNTLAQLVNLANLDIQQIQTQLGLDAQESTNFKTTFGELGSLFVQSGLGLQSFPGQVA